MDSTLNSLKKQFNTEVKLPAKNILSQLNKAETINENPQKIITINEQLVKIKTGVDDLKEKYSKGLTGTRNGYKTIIVSSIGTVVSFIVGSVAWGVSEGSSSTKNDHKNPLHTLRWVFGGVAIGFSLILMTASIIYGCKKVKRKRIEKEIDTKNFQLLLGELSEFIKAIDLLKNTTNDIDGQLKNCMKKYDELDPKTKKQIPSKGKWIPLIIEQLPSQDELRTGLSLIKQKHEHEYENNEPKKYKKKEYSFTEKSSSEGNDNEDNSTDENILKEFNKSKIVLNESIELNILEKSNNDWAQNFLQQDHKPTHKKSERGLKLSSSNSSLIEENPLQNFWEMLERRADTTFDTICIGDVWLTKEGKIKPVETSIIFEN